MQVLTFKHQKKVIHHPNRVRDKITELSQQMKENNQYLIMNKMLTKLGLEGVFPDVIKRRYYGNFSRQHTCYQ